MAAQIGTTLSPRSAEKVAELDTLTSVLVLFNDGSQIVVPLTEKLDKLIVKHKKDLKRRK